MPTGEDFRAIALSLPRLATDPWTPMGLLSIVDVQPWRILLGRGA